MSRRAWIMQPAYGMQSLVGLSEAEARARLLQYGPNDLGERKLAGALEAIVKILLDPMGLMLLILAVVYGSLGKTDDSIILLVAYVPIVGIDVLLEVRSRKALRSLTRSLKTSCLVIRAGARTSISVRDLVPGDLLLLEEGQTLPVDGILTQVSNLTLDESSVTGESIPVKRGDGEDVLSGTTVLTGSGIVQVEKTGANSQIGSIAKTLAGFAAVPSPLLRSVRKVVKIVFAVALALGVLIFAIDLAHGHALSESLIGALTLAMAAIPEEFPLVFSLYLSLAAYRLSKKGILVKTLPAVEGLARVDVICTDKTGTLTEGKFCLDAVLGPMGEPPLSDDDLAAFVFACEPRASDAMEVAMLDWLCQRKGERFAPSLLAKWELQFDYPLDAKDKHMSHVWMEPATGRQVLAMKGAIEGVMAHCEATPQAEQILTRAQAEASAGKRLLALAVKAGRFSGDRTSDERELALLCVLSFTDPVRPSVSAAIQKCVERGIKIKMLTGDHLLTAHAIADQICLPHDQDQLFNGPDLERLSPPERVSAFQRGVIFARLKPQQKLELVEALKAQGAIVAMTGDGINDAPALKLADVGISMGERATDVARSTAQLILMRNDFGGIIESIVEGESVLASLSRSFGYLIAFHFPVILVALYQAFFLTQPILEPIHIVLLELIVHPVSAFVFVHSARDSGSARKALITREQVLWSSGRGLLLTLGSLLIFNFAPGSASHRGGAAVLLLIAGNAGLLLAECGGLRRIFGKAEMRGALAAGLLVVLTTLLAYVPPMSRVFAIPPPPLSLFAEILALGLALGLVVRSARSGASR